LGRLKGVAAEKPAAPVAHETVAAVAREPVAPVAREPVAPVARESVARLPLLLAAEPVTPVARVPVAPVASVPVAPVARVPVAPQPARLLVTALAPPLQPTRCPLATRPPPLAALAPPLQPRASPLLPSCHPCSPARRPCCPPRSPSSPAPALLTAPAASRAAPAAPSGPTAAPRATPSGPPRAPAAREPPLLPCATPLAARLSPLGPAHRPCCTACHPYSPACRHLRPALRPCSHRAAPAAPRAAPCGTLVAPAAPCVAPCGPPAPCGQGRECYFLLVVDDYTRYTTVFPLRSKGEVTDPLDPCSPSPALRAVPPGPSCPASALLRDICHGEGFLQSFTLPASPQQNGIAERSINLVMDVARTSMIHAAAPHFLLPFAVWYAAHQPNLWPRVSLPETSPTLRWTGKVGDASVFWVWGSRAFVRDTSADKLSAHAIPCVFLEFPHDAPGWQFYHPTLHRVLPYQDVPLR
ncbi:unnamed protein product, partial [Closterium sp. NIES-53]